MGELDNYHREKFGNAVHTLAESLGDIRSRVLNATIALITVNPGQFSDKVLGDKYAALFARMSSKQEKVPGEGTIQATLREMSDEDVVACAREIVDIHNEMLYQAKPVA